MGLSRYSRDRELRSRQERFDRLQIESNYLDGSPNMAELHAAGIRTAHAECRSAECWHRGRSFSIADLPSDLTANELRRRRSFVCGKCGTRRATLRLDMPDELRG